MSDGTKAGLAGGGGATVTGGMLAASGGFSWGMILVVALVIFVVFFLAFWFVLRVISQRRDRGLFDELKSDSERFGRGGPEEKGEDLRELRAKFLRGLTEYQKQAKTGLANSPWFLVMGASGSGKSRALENCGDDFWIKDLTDVRAGMGGTRFMDWWFSRENGIYLDTAGRFVDTLIGEGTEESEQQVRDRLKQLEEFLKLVRKYRPHCPINGMIAVVSAVDLQTKTPEALESDALKLRRTLQAVQVALDVRIPVMVWVSKCDKVPGFRDYFAGIARDPLHNQMFGWSKPGGKESLNDRFDPGQMEQELRKVAEELKARRWAVLENWVPLRGWSRPEAASFLYVFPDRLTDLFPPLRTYLGNIFGDQGTAGKLPFFRGVYFTSAMTEGEELDRQLARAQNRDLASYVEEEKEQKRKGKNVYLLKLSMFLVDTLREKLVKERNLVTRYSDAVAGMRRAQWYITGLMAVAVAVMGLWVWFMSQSFEHSIDRQRRLWQFVAQGMGNPDAVVLLARNVGADGTIQYFPRLDNKPDENPAANNLTAYLELAAYATNDLHVPLVFKLFSTSRHDLHDMKRLQAWKIVAAQFAFKPILTNADEALRNSQQWDAAQHVPVLKAVIDWESIRRVSPPPASAQSHVMSVLVNFLSHLGGNSATAQLPDADVAGLDALQDLYLRLDAGTNLPSFGNTLDQNPAFAHLLGLLVAKSDEGTNEFTALLAPFAALTNATENFVRSELSFTDWGTNNPDLSAPAPAAAAFDDLRGRYGQYRRNLNQLANDLAGPERNQDPGVEFSNRMARAQDELFSELLGVQAALPADQLAGDLGRESLDLLATNIGVLKVVVAADSQDVANYLAGHDYLFQVVSAGKPNYLQRNDYYAQALKSFAPLPAYNVAGMGGRARATQRLNDKLASYRPSDVDLVDLSFTNFVAGLLQESMAYHTNRWQRELAMHRNKFGWAAGGGFPKQLIAEGWRVADLTNWLDQVEELTGEQLAAGQPPDADLADLKAGLLMVLSDDRTEARKIQIATIKPSDFNQIWAAVLNVTNVPMVMNNAQDIKINGRFELNKLENSDAVPLSLDDPEFLIRDVSNVNQSEVTASGPEFSSPWAPLQFLLAQDSRVMMSSSETNLAVWINFSQDGPYALQIKCPGELAKLIVKWRAEKR